MKEPLYNINDTFTREDIVFEFEVQDIYNKNETIYYLLKNINMNSFFVTSEEILTNNYKKI